MIAEFLKQIVDGALDLKELSEAIKPLLKDAEEVVTVGVSNGVHSGIDRLNGAKARLAIVNGAIEVTFEFPPPRPMK